MSRVAIVVAAAVVLLGLPSVHAMSGMGATDRGPNAACTSDCRSGPPMDTCVMVCVAVVALLTSLGPLRRSLTTGRASARSLLFVEQLSDSSLFRPPRTA